jgi:PTH1 family peptidyl-tRNA hydrolase
MVNLKLIVGLGNPGRKYEKTRHNVGFRVVEALASEQGITFSEKKETYFLGRLSINHEPLWVAMPRTFMNQSGIAVKQLLDKTGVDPSQMIVVHDDIDLALGRIQIKTKGGHGGHKGILSILSTLKTDHFYRLRVGVGRPPQGLDPADYVLQPFEGHAEHSLLDKVIQNTTEALRCLVAEGPQKAMDRYNQKVNRG